MKNRYNTYFRSLVLLVAILFTATSSFASHVIGAELRYKWVSGLTYDLTVILYGDCGPSSAGSFRGLPVGRPQVCIYDGGTAATGTGFTTGSASLVAQAPICGLEVTPVCPDSILFTTCASTAYTIPGIKKFVYTGTVTLPRNSTRWRFIYTSNNGSGSTAYSCSFFTGSSGGVSSGRTGSITNLSAGSSIQLIDTLNTSFRRGHNSSPVLTVEPTPFFCLSTVDCYNPGAIDLYDTSVLYNQPSGDSLIFSLIPATNGTGSCGTIGGPVTYLGLAWPGQPCGGSTPLNVAAATDFSFDPVTGQLCFTPNVTQRSTVVYNIEEYFHDTLVGTMQREMNFNILPCVLTNPEGEIDSFTAGPGADTTSGTSFFACQYTGFFNLDFNPSEPDTSLNIIVTATGLPSGVTFTVINNNTNHPHGTITGNTGTILPGSYTFYLTYQDSHCPISGKTTKAFTVTIYPVPSIRDSIISRATCTQKSAILIIPGGYGKPWTVKVSNDIGDTLQTFTDTTSFVDSLSPGTYHLTIFTVFGSLCHMDDTIHIDTPRITSPVTYTDPTYCGAANGTLVLHSLFAGDIDTVFYNLNGVLQPPVGFIVSGAGTDTVTGLLAGVYNNIIVKSGFCLTTPAGPDTLRNPPFTFRAITKSNPTKCGYCDGTDTLFGIHPGQLDTISYILAGITHTTTFLIGADSMVVFTGLCSGSYNNITVQTAGVCNATIAGPIILDSPRISASFMATPIFGCKGDSVDFSNRSVPASDLTYKWDFGDGYTDTATNPKHLYVNTHTITYNIMLYITNGKCVDSMPQSILLDNYVKAGFEFVPNPYVCQNSPVTFTDTSKGTSPAGMAPLAYNWSFGDGNFDNNFNEIHSYANTGKYTVRLIVNNAIPCFDTAYGTIYVDSISPISIQATDSVMCRGNAVTFTGIYTSIGDTGVIWSFGDGNMIKNVNPVVHAFDGTGTLTVSANVKYRACPELFTSRKISVYPLPQMYLGEDKSMCPGSQPILLSDETNNTFGSGAKWQWSTGETGSSIYVTKPGMYFAKVTIDGCTNTDTVFIANDCYVSVPNVFTPNGDGINDYFFPRQFLTAGVTTFTMNIYNRWGQQVYATSTTDGRGWDGYMNSVPQPAGVYIYVIDAAFKDGQIEHHTGNVTLIR